MRLTGPLLLAFIVYHILHLTTGTVHPDFHEGTVYHNLVTGLQVVPGGGVLRAGDGGAGAPPLARRLEPVPDPRRRARRGTGRSGRRIATVFTVVVVLGFAAVPLAVLAGFVK